LRIHSSLPHGALNGSNGWTHNLEARGFAPTFCPIFLGTQKREAAAPKASGCFMGKTCAVREEPGTHKPRSCRAQEFGPKPCPGKGAAEKAGLLNREDRNDVSRLTWTARPEHKDSNCRTPSLRVLERSRLEWPLRRRALDGCGANALGQGGSNCATAAQLMSPMMTWGACGRFYLHVANDQGIDCPFWGLQRSLRCLIDFRRHALTIDNSCCR
jgi:hypothetical protein